MSQFIDITQREKLNSLLQTLQPETPAHWGRLKAQNMIEHLTEAVEYTNGKRIANLATSADEAALQKQLKVNHDFEIPRGAKGFLRDATENIRCDNLQTAVNELNCELDAFELYFKMEGRTAIHPAFGPMNYQEWVIWHGKHFAHHFRQFNLLNY